MRMVRRTFSTRPANSGTFRRFPSRSMISISAGRVVDGGMIFRPMIFRPMSRARIIHSTDDVIAVLSLTRRLAARRLAPPLHLSNRGVGSFCSHSLKGGSHVLSNDPASIRTPAQEGHHPCADEKNEGRRSHCAD